MTRVVHLLNSTGGGAGRAVGRLHRGLLGLGVESQVVCTDNSSSLAPAVIVKRQDVDSEWTAAVQKWDSLTKPLVETNRTSISNTAFHLGYPGYDLTQVEAVRNADILHLHWTPKLLSIRGIEELLRLGKPTFWTLHDYWAVSGGYHFPAGLKDYQDPVHDCTQLFKDNGMDALLRQDKAASFDYDNLHVVALSRAMQENIRRSVVLGKRRSSIWYNAVETDVFTLCTPERRRMLRRVLGVGEQSVVFLNIAQNIREARKGFSYFMRALHVLSQREDMQEVLNRGQVVVVSVGQHSLNVPDPRIQQISLPSIHDDSALADVFAASDLLVHPALEEGFSLVILEAMASGLPVLSFDNGGSLDILKDGVNGFLLPGDRDSVAMAKVIAQVALNPDIVRDMMGAARTTAERYNPERITRDMIEVYRKECPVDCREAYDGEQPSEAFGALFSGSTVELPLDPRLSAWLSRQPLPAEFVEAAT